MRHYRIMTMVAAAMFALVATAQQTSFTVNDEQRHQTITVTAVDDDIVRVDVVSDGWTGQRLPSLALDRTPRGNVKVNNWEDVSMSKAQMLPRHFRCQSQIYRLGSSWCLA